LVITKTATNSFPVYNKRLLFGIPRPKPYPLGGGGDFGSKRQGPGHEGALEVDCGGVLLRLGDGSSPPPPPHPNQ